MEERHGRPAVNPVMRSLLEDLAGDGASVAVRVPEREVLDPLDGRRADLVLLKSDTDFALSRAVADEIDGTLFLNGARPTRRTHDKGAALAHLAAAGLPVPKTFLFRPGGQDVRPDLGGPWVVKPVRGVHGRGVSFHETVTSALAVPAEAGFDGAFVADDGTRLLQSRVGGDAADLKVYVANGRCFAGEKTFGAASYASDEIEPVVLDRGTEETVLAVGEALRLRLFGVDLRFDAERPVVVDANPFPGYRGFPQAVAALRAEIEKEL